MSKASPTVRILRVVMPIIGLSIAIIMVPWTMIWLWLQPLPGTIANQAYEATEHGLDGIMVYVEQGGKPAKIYTAGWKDREKAIPADPKALFKIASIRKLFVALSIAKLANAGQLSLDKTLADYFPELAGRIENADKIAIKLMVQHRSGIPNFTDAPGYWSKPAETREAALALALDLPANFAPDSDYGYSNTNYLLLGMLIEKLSGGSQQQYIKAHILKPLGLNNTYFSLDEINIDDLMGGYYVGIEQDIKSNDYGSMIATIEDIGRFIRALNDGSAFANDKEEQAIYTSIYQYGHKGLVPGYHSIARYHKDIDTVVVQFVNTTDFAYTGSTSGVALVVYNRILSILRGE